MKLKGSTIALALTALLTGGIIVAAEITRDPSASRSANGVEDLFDIEERQVQSFSITTPLRSIAFERDADDLWQMTEPETGPANPAAIAYVLNLLATGNSARTLEVPAEEWEAFGFHQPLAVINFTLKDGNTHRLMVGEYDFSRTTLYALKDYPDAAPTNMSNLDVLLVSPDFENAVSRPIEDWQQPPEASDGETGQPPSEDTTRDEAPPEADSAEDVPTE